MNPARSRKILSLSLRYPQENSFFSDQEETIYACINPPQKEVDAQKAIPLPLGSFEIQSILDCLPSNWQPDLISISSSLSLATHPPIPQGVKQLSYSTVMKLTDSHHMNRPLQRIIEYAKAVDCDYTWTTYNRQHLHFFKEAGLNNCFWMPGAISIFPHEVKLTQFKRYDVLFCGTLNQSHPYRFELINFLQESGINVTIQRFPYTQALEAYTQAKIVFNCSLNGDFNRRVFEVLMAGGFLLTDRLPPQSGLPLLFAEKQHLDCYGTPQELLDKVKYFLDHQAEAEAIAARGKEELWKFYQPELLREKFYNFVTERESIPDLFLGTNDKRITHILVNQKTFKCRLKIYEFIQEAHRLNQEIKVLFWKINEQNFIEDLKDLPRLILLESVRENLQDSHITILSSVVNFSQLQDSINELNSSLPINGILCLIGDNESKKTTSFLRKRGFMKIRDDVDYSLYQKIQGTSKTLTWNLPKQPQENSVLTKILRKLKRLILSSWKTD